MKAFYETRYYETAIKIWHKKYTNMRFISHWHTEIEFIYVLKGSIEVTIEKEKIEAKAGDLIIVDGGNIHSSNLNFKKNSLEFIIFDSAIINSTFRDFNLKSSLLTKEMLVQRNLDNHLNNLLLLIRDEEKEKDIYYDEIIAAAIKQFCFKLKRLTVDLIDANKPNERKDRINEFQLFLDYIENNYQKNITLEQGAQMLNVSHSYFSTKFKEYTGFTFIKYLNTVRIENSIIQMKQNNDTIIEIAFSNGFNNIRTFNRVFKELICLTPTEFLSKSLIYQDNFLQRVRKSSQIEHTQEFTNKTIYPE